MYAIPVWISEHLTFLRDYNVLALMGFGIVAAVIWLSSRLVALHPAFAQNKRRRVAFAFLLAYVFVFFTAPMYFLDREHVLLVFTFPYMLRYIPSLARTALPMRLRVAVGLLGAVGFCIKPHALIIFAVLQLMYMVRERSAAILVSVENLIIYVIGALYISAIVFCMPEYLHTILPMAMATYSAYSRKLSGIYSIVIFLVIMGMTFADFRPRYRSPLRREVYYFLGICGGYLAYALANNGWSYTYNPLISMARIITGWVMMEFLWLKADAVSRGEPTRPFVFGARSCGLNLTLNLLFYLLTFSSFFFAFDCDTSVSCRSGRIFMTEAKQYHPHSFGIMSLEFYKGSELSRETGAEWDTRFNHLWMLPKFLLSGPEFTKQNQWIIDYVGNAYAEDLGKWKPEVLYIDSSPKFFAHQDHFDLVGYFSQVPAFADAWKQYRRSGVIDSCLPPPDKDPKSKGVESDCRFDVYSRIPSP
jgi:hypothetical protein